MATQIERLLDDSTRNLQGRLKEIDGKYADTTVAHHNDVKVKNPYPALRGVACIPCTKNHLSTISGALSEAVRFARSEDVASPEVQRRLGIVEDELNIWERVDATPDKIAQLPEDQQKIMREALRRGRELRHYLEESGLSFGKGTVEEVSIDLW